MVGKVKEWNAAAVLGSWLGCRGEGPKRKLLTSIALVGCRKIMDARISALAHDSGLILVCHSLSLCAHFFFSFFLCSNFDFLYTWNFFFTVQYVDT